MTAPTIIRVALPVPRGDSYDYLAPAQGPVPAPGQRVRVPFGPRRLVGLVVEQPTESPMPSAKLRSILETLDEEPLVDDAWLALLRFAADYYQSALGAAIATALPATLRRGRAARPIHSPRWQLTPEGRAQDPAALARAPRQAAALTALLASSQPLAAGEIGAGDVTTATLRALQNKGWVEAATLETLRCEGIAAILDPAQQAAVESVVDSSPLGEFACHLLDGVTGSGKTEVYLHLAQRQLAAGRQTLLLVPEIGLTPQMVARVQRGTGARVVALHSGLADGERHNAWLAARDGSADIVLGTRSAVFTPLARPGLIIVDEEHDGSFKQQDGMRYHARDLAVRRAQLLRIPVLLGSATPALETLHNAATGRYQHLRLQQRHGVAQAPRMRIIDLRGARCPDGLSRQLIEATSRQLDAGNQVLLFLNRRGYSPVMLCAACGWSAHCERCDARLISHRRSHSLRCHHCDHRRPLPSHCPDCQARELIHVGQGTERLEARAAQLWPDVATLRLDRDALQRRGELEAALRRIERGEVQLLIGTQMLAKGHDFARLSLVGIIDADQGLYGQDFRASEHLAQLVTQVAGRAGRRAAAGEVLLQTHNPDHPLLQALDPAQYSRVAQGLLTERQALGWPPFSRLALVRAQATRAADAEDELSAIAVLVAPDSGVEVFGPVPAAMERRAGRYQFHLLLRSEQWRSLQAITRLIRQNLESRPSARKIRWSIDVDPQFLD